VSRLCRWGIWIGLALLSGLGCTQIAGPELQIERALREIESRGATVEVPKGGDLVVRSIRFDRVLVKPEAKGFIAVVTVDAEAVLDKGVAVSYLGLERIPFVRAERRLEPQGPLLPGLYEVLSLLMEHRSSLSRLGTPQAFRIRIERDQAQVLVERGANEPRSRFDLPREGGQLRIAPGLL
jgi:hypothetical protein